MHTHMHLHNTLCVCVYLIKLPEATVYLGILWIILNAFLTYFHEHITEILNIRIQTE